MKTLVKLLLAALVINGCIQGGLSAWRQFQFKDSVEQEARFGNNKTTSELQRRLMALAAEQGLSLQPEYVQVERRGEFTYVGLTYTDTVPLVPRVYTHKRDLNITMTVSSLHPLINDK
jgi:hypothetical protein